MKKQIYVVEDDTALQELYTYTLENEFDCLCFSGSDSFYGALTVKKPDLVLLDIMLPGDDGFKILTQLKGNKTTEHIPVIMVSAKEEEVSKVRGLNMGADDYISKPFGVLELIARIKVHLRKNKKTTDSIAFKDVEINPEKHQVTISGTPIQVTNKEYNLLRLLCENAEKVQERESIFVEVWGESFMGETRTLDIHIKELRKKLSEAESQAEIKTIRRVGYMLV